MDLNKLVKTFNNKGFVKIDNFFTKKELNILIDFVNKNLKKNNQKTFFLTSKTNNEIFEFFKKNLFIEKKLKKFIFDLGDKLKVNNYNQKNIYSVLRVIKKKRIDDESFNFHFDAHLMTILVPIIIPNRKRSNNGHLLLSPNLRKINSSIFLNVFQKIYYQIILKKIFSKSFLQKYLKFKKIILKPQSIFLFNGFRSLHGNLDIDKRDTRATMLLHYNDLFPNSNLVKINRILRIKKEKKRILNNLND